VAQVGTGRGARRLAQGDEAAVGQDCLDGIDKVLDITVGRGELARGPGGDPAPDAGHGDGLWPVAGGQPLGGDLLLGFQAILAGVEGGQQVLRINAAGGAHGAHVEEDGLGAGDDAAHHAAAQAEGNERRPGRRGDPDHGLDIGDRRRPDNAGGGRSLCAQAIADMADHPIVVASILDLVRGGQHLGLAKGGLQLGNGGHVRYSQSWC